MCQCCKVKDRQRETDRLRHCGCTLPLCLKEPHPGWEMDFPFYPGSSASFKAIPVALRPRSELWEQLADVSLLGGLGKHTRLAPRPHNPRQNKSLVFWKGMDYGSRISPHRARSCCSPRSPGASSSLTSMVFFAKMHSEGAAHAPDISWFTGTDKKKKITPQCGYQKIQVVKAL